MQTFFFEWVQLTQKILPCNKWGHSFYDLISSIKHTNQNSQIRWQQRNTSQ